MMGERWVRSCVGISLQGLEDEMGLGSQGRPGSGWFHGLEHWMDLGGRKWRRGHSRRLRGKESACDAGDVGSIPGWGKSLEGGNGNPFQYSCLENPMDRGAWKVMVRAVPRVRHNWVTEHTHTFTKERRTFCSCLSHTVQPLPEEEPLSWLCVYCCLVTRSWGTLLRPHGL